MQKYKYSLSISLSDECALLFKYVFKMLPSIRVTLKKSFVVNKIDEYLYMFFIIILAIKIILKHTYKQKARNVLKY